MKSQDLFSRNNTTQTFYTIVAGFQSKTKLGELGFVSNKKALIMWKNDQKLSFFYIMYTFLFGYNSYGLYLYTRLYLKLCRGE